MFEIWSLAPLLAQSDPATAGSEMLPLYPGVLLYATILAAAHLLAPQIRARFEKQEREVASLGGGMAVGYVFAHLLPELDKGHAMLGEFIFVLALISLVIYYGLEKYMLLHKAKYVDSEGEHRNFRLKLTQLAVYNWLIVYGTPTELAESGFHAIPVVLAIGIHLVHADYSFSGEYPQPFVAWGRYVLAAAPLIGWITVVIDGKTNDELNDIFVALLAGTILYNVFKEELPEHDKSHFRWFLAGATGFVAFAYLEHGLR